MARMKLGGPTLRLPMTPLEPAHHATVEGALRASRLI
jgi:4-hydroxy-tetrahydrodipicolinate synthase